MSDYSDVDDNDFDLSQSLGKNAFSPPAKKTAIPSVSLMSKMTDEKKKELAKQKAADQMKRFE